MTNDAPQWHVLIPCRFYDDHVERDLPAPPAQPMKGRYLVPVLHPDTDELLNDAEHYAHRHGPDAGIGLKTSARATVKAIKDARATHHRPPRSSDASQ